MASQYLDLEIAGDVDSDDSVDISMSETRVQWTGYPLTHGKDNAQSDSPACPGRRECVDVLCLCDQGPDWDLEDVRTVIRHGSYLG